MPLRPGDDRIELNYTAHWIFEAQHAEELRGAGSDPMLISMLVHKASMRQFMAAKEQLEGKQVSIRFAHDEHGKYIHGRFLVCEVFPEMTLPKSFCTLFVFPIAGGKVRLTRLHIVHETTVIFC